MSSTQIQVTASQAFDSKEKREMFAQFVSKIFAGASGDPIVYPVTPTEEYEYVVDKQNNWKVIFDKENNRRVGFIFRYFSPALEEAAARFIAHLYGAEGLYHAAHPN